MYIKIVLQIRAKCERSFQKFAIIYLAFVFGGESGELILDAGRRWVVRLTATDRLRVATFNRLSCLAVLRLKSFFLGLLLLYFTRLQLQLH